MATFQIHMLEYRKLLAKGSIQTAYKGLMEYFMRLRTHFQKKYPDHVVSGNVYVGYMDMTYFSFFPESLKQRGLKIAIVFLHEAFRFEIWLAGYNKKVQSQYWKKIKESGWNKYRIVPTTKGADSILEHTLVENPDFSNLDSLTEQIEHETLIFIKEVENYLLMHQF